MSIAQRSCGNSWADQLHGLASGVEWVMSSTAAPFPSPRDCVALTDQRFPGLIGVHDLATQTGSTTDSSSSDELMHPILSDNAWSESYYFNFVDPSTGLGMFTRMGFRPGSGWVDALHVVYLGGKRVAFTYGRRPIEAPLSNYDGDLSAGDLTIECVEHFKQWRLRFEGDAQDIADSKPFCSSAASSDQRTGSRLQNCRWT